MPLRLSLYKILNLAEKKMSIWLFCCNTWENLFHFENHWKLTPNHKSQKVLTRHANAYHLFTILHANAYHFFTILFIEKRKNVHMKLDVHVRLMYS